MSKQNNSNPPVGGNLFQFDVEQPDLDMYNRWLSNAFDEFMGNPADLEALTFENLFNSGKFMKLDVQCWMQPGYYINFLIIVDFSYEQDTMRAGRYVAPCQMTARTTFNYPFDTEHSFVASLRTNPGYFVYQQLTTVVMNIISQVGSVLLNSEGLL